MIRFKAKKIWQGNLAIWSYKQNGTQSRIGGNDFTTTINDTQLRKKALKAAEAMTRKIHRQKFCDISPGISASGCQF